MTAMFAYNDNDNMRGGTAEVVSKISGVSVERDDGKHNPFSFSFPSPLWSFMLPVVIFFSSVRLKFPLSPQKFFT